MTKEALAKKLCGREPLELLSESEESEAKAANLVVIYPYDKNQITFLGLHHGALTGDSEVGVKFNARGIRDKRGNLFGCEFAAYDAGAPNCATFEAAWTEFPLAEWNFITDEPCALFELDDGTGTAALIGIVLDAGELPFRTEMDDFFVTRKEP